MVSMIEKELGGVDVLINNAAIDLSNLFHLKNADEFRRTLDVNVVGAYNCSKRVYKHMLTQEYGRIINISSTNGIDSFYPYSMDYDASKAGLHILTKDLAIELSPKIRVNAVAPGFFWTALQPACWEAAKIPTLGADAPMKRAGQTFEIAPLFVYLASDDSSYVTGQTMHINGGQYKG